MSRTRASKTTSQPRLEKANRLGYVETLLGRKRFFPELQNARLPYNQRQAVERAAINAPIQGTAADIMKIAMIRLHVQLRERGYGRVYCSRCMTSWCSKRLMVSVTRSPNSCAVTMANAFQLAVPLKVDVEVGPNWYDLEPV